MAKASSTSFWILVLLLTTTSLVEGSVASKAPRQDGAAFGLSRIVQGFRGVNDEKSNPDEVSRIPVEQVEYTVSASMPLPFSPKVAYKEYSDFTRHPDWSSSLRRVISTAPPNGSRTDMGEFKWFASVLGIPYTSVCRGTKKVIRKLLPNRNRYRVQWDSVSGVDMKGTVEFSKQQGSTVAQYQVSFVPPRLFAAVFPRPDTMLRFVENYMLKNTLQQFSDSVAQQTAQG